MLLFAHFYVELVVFDALICKSFHFHYELQIFSQVYCLPFDLPFNVSFFFCHTLFFYNVGFCVILGKVSSYQIFFLNPFIFSSSIFMVSFFSFKSLVYLEFIVVLSMR